MLGIVLINYRNESEIIHYIVNELSKIKTNHKIVIIDNSDNDKNHNDLLIGLNQISIPEKPIIIKAKSNLGYAKANNLGAKYLLENFNINYILFSNSDIKFKDDDVVESLIEKLNDLPPSAGIINPKITGEKGNDQTPFNYISFYYRYFIRIWFFPVLYRKIDNIVYNLQNTKEGFYYRFSGSFFIIAKNAFIDAGMFDSNTFLYAEEQILAERLKAKGYKFYYYPQKKVIHNSSTVVKAFFSDKKKERLLFKSNSYYYRKYKGTSSFVIFLGRIALEVYLFTFIPLINIFRTIKIKLKNE